MNNNQKSKNKSNSGDKQSNNNKKDNKGHSKNGNGNGNGNGNDDDEHKVQGNGNKNGNKHDKNAKKNEDDEHKTHVSSSPNSRKLNNKSVDETMINKFEDKTEIFIKTVNVKEIEYFDVNEWKTMHFYSKFPVNWNQEKRRLLPQHQLEYMYRSMLVYRPPSPQNVYH